MTQYSHKSNNTPFAHTSRQSTSSSLGQRGSVSSPALTVPAVDNAPSTDAECSILHAPSDPPMSTTSAVYQRWRSPSSILHRSPTSSVPSCFLKPPVHADLPRCSDLHRGTPTSTEVLRYPQISTVIYQRRSLTAYILSDSPDDDGRSTRALILRRSHVLANTRQWKVASHPSDQTPPGTATSPSIADCCGLPDVTPPRQDDATTRIMSRSHDEDVVGAASLRKSQTSAKISVVLTFIQWSTQLTKHYIQNNRQYTQ